MLSEPQESESKLNIILFYLIVFLIYFFITRFFVPQRKLWGYYGPEFLNPITIFIIGASSLVIITLAFIIPLILIGSANYLVKSKTVYILMILISPFLLMKSLNLVLPIFNLRPGGFYPGDDFQPIGVIFIASVMNIFILAVIPFLKKISRKFLIMLLIIGILFFLLTFFLLFSASQEMVLSNNGKNCYFLYRAWLYENGGESIANYVAGSPAAAKNVFNYNLILRDYGDICQKDVEFYVNRFWVFDNEVALDEWASSQEEIELEKRNLIQNFVPS